ncbi:MAG: hypothetical protein K4571_18520 [Deltaproteobacteria bacterium]
MKKIFFFTILVVCFFPLAAQPETYHYNLNITPNNTVGSCVLGLTHGSTFTNVITGCWGQCSADSSKTEPKLYLTCSIVVVGAIITKGYNAEIHADKTTKSVSCNVSKMYSMCGSEDCVNFGCSLIEE